MNKDRIGVAVLLLGLVALLGFEAMNYARKTSVEAVKPKAVTQSAEPRESAAAGPVAKAGEPEREATEAQLQSSPSAVEIPADWSTFSADEFGFQIARPANWPASVSGNVLTIGDPVGDGHTKCYVTIEFQKSPGQFVPAANTHLAYEEVEQGKRCNETLAKIIRSGKFTK